VKFELLLLHYYHFLLLSTVAAEIGEFILSFDAPFQVFTYVNSSISLLIFMYMVRFFMFVLLTISCFLFHFVLLTKLYEFYLICWSSHWNPQVFIYPYVYSVYKFHVNISKLRVLHNVMYCAKHVIVI